MSAAEVTAELYEARQRVRLARLAEEACGHQGALATEIDRIEASTLPRSVRDELEAPLVAALVAARAATDARLGAERALARASSGGGR